VSSGVGISAPAHAEKCSTEFFRRLFSRRQFSRRQCFRRLLARGVLPSAVLPETKPLSMDRFEEVKLRIKEATDLVALVESYLPLRPRGKNLVALCPFHAENSPSFAVHREEQYFHCFGCGKSGDAFTWLMERDGLSFREAMEVLADRAGISLEGVFQQRGGEARKGPDALQGLAAAADFFHASLRSPAGARAREYLAARGLLAAVEDWQLGFHPEGGALARMAQQQGVPSSVLEMAGLWKQGREPFAGRLMFPIADERGRVVAFGGRLLPGGSAPRGDYTPPKYLNSPESPLFNKRRVLFGLHRCKRAGQRRLLVVEGYTDVIACHLAGFPGAVASLGTAFTQDHARVVERYATDGLVLMFDGDRAGQQAAERALRELINSRLVVRVALMSDAQGEGVTAKDPADIVVARPGEDAELVTERRARFADCIEGAEDQLAVWFRLLRRRIDLSLPVHVEAAARECAELLGLVTEPVRQAAMLQQMARHLALPVAALERMLQKEQQIQRQQSQRQQAQRKGSAASADGDGGDGGGGANRPAPPTVPRRAPTLAERAEIDLLACVLKSPPLLIDLDTSADAPLASAAVSQLLAQASDGLALGRELGPALLKYLFARVAEQPELRSALGAAARRMEAIADPVAVMAGLQEGRRRLHNEPLRRSLRQELQRALASGDRARADSLQTELLASMRTDRPRRARTGSSAAGTSAAPASSAGTPLVPPATPGPPPGQG